MTFMRYVLSVAAALAIGAVPAAAQPQAATTYVLELNGAELEYFARTLDSHIRAHGLPAIEDVAHLKRKLQDAKPKAAAVPAPKD